MYHLKPKASDSLLLLKTLHMKETPLPFKYAVWYRKHLEPRIKSRQNWLRTQFNLLLPKKIIKNMSTIMSGFQD